MQLLQFVPGFSVVGFGLFEFGIRGFNLGEQVDGAVSKGFGLLMTLTGYGPTLLGVDGVRIMLSKHFP